jgi:hypothetical protein
MSLFERSSGKTQDVDVLYMGIDTAPLDGTAAVHEGEFGYLYCSYRMLNLLVKPRC